MDLSKDAKEALIAASSLLRLSSLRYCAPFSPVVVMMMMMMMMMIIVVVFFYLYEALISAQVFVSLFNLISANALHDTHERGDDGIHNNDKDDDVCVTNNASFYVTSAFE